MSVLSSDILEQQFGATQVKVLMQNAQQRLITTEVVATGKILEVSSVRFFGIPKKYMSIHEQVVQGESMGKAFRQHNVPFNRSTKGIWYSPVPQLFQKLFQSINNTTVVEVAITVGDESLAYATIVEAYSPSVSWPESSNENIPQYIQESLKQTALLLT